MDSKPIVTCHGDQTLFSKLHTLVVQGLPKETVEWKRSYGRPRRLSIEANFVPFNPDILPEDDDWSLPGRPMFHTYWLDCDIDTYKATVKEDISDWLTNLKDDNIPDWLIIVIVNDESKVKTKILRTSVYDKVKSDFCGKNSDRCIVLTEPLKTDSKSSESWQALLARMRSLLLQSYNRNISRFEEHMRAERERRTEAGWNFCGYFLLQEELALMFEMLHLYEEALIQYDELDALFTQYILNHAAGDRAPWLSTFICSQHQTWDGLCLSQPIDVIKRQLIRKARASVLDFRNYLFSRQVALMFLLGRPEEVAERAVPFMHNCKQELRLLEVEMPPGALACWVFISCQEILKQCDNNKTVEGAENHYLQTASLHDYTRLKLQEIGKVCGFFLDDPGTEPDHNKVSLLLDGASARVQKWRSDTEGKCCHLVQELGDICGLFPDDSTSSYQLNLVVDLIAGLNKETDPIIKLKEALSSKESFQRHYLELSELAMGTYKFIGRLRSARQIGRDLAAYYMRLGEWQKAESFLQDALRMYRHEGWDKLADYIRLDITQCHRKLGDQQKLVRDCVHIAGSEFIPEDIRRPLQAEMISLTQQFKEEPVLISSQPVFWMSGLSLSSHNFILHQPGYVTFTLKSLLPATISCDSIMVSSILESTSLDDSHSSINLLDLKKKRHKPRRRHSSTSSVTSITSVSSVEFYNHVLQTLDNQTRTLDLYEQMELRADNKTVAMCGLAHRGALYRADVGAPRYREREMKKEDYEFVFEARDVNLEPGNNTVRLTGQFPDRGSYGLSQLCIQVAGLELLSSLSQDHMTFSVSCDEPELTITPSTEPVLAGLDQTFTLTLNTGSYELEAGAELSLRHPDTLTFRGQGVTDGVIELPACAPKQDVTFDLDVFCQLPEDVEQLKEFYDHQVDVYCSALSRGFQVKLTFVPPFRISHQLHTAGTKKFVQVALQGVTSREISLSEHHLVAESDDVELLPLNRPDKSLVIREDTSALYIWQLKNNIQTSPCLSCVFTVNYSAEGEDTTRILNISFNLTDYMTLLIASTSVKPTDGATCRTGGACYLDVSVKALPTYSSTTDFVLMYDVIANPETWAIIGKTTGVFEVVDGSYKTRLDATPLIGGQLPLPKVKVTRCSKPKLDVPSHPDSATIEAAGDSENDSAHNQLPEILPFSPGQVYYSSLGLQIDIIPATNTNPVEVTIAT